jgi:hypothetical protein
VTISDKAKHEISRELATIAIEQATLLHKIEEIEASYEAGLLSHGELVILTKLAMERQKLLSERTERIYK